jgi:hypothetical protein
MTVARNLVTACMECNGGKGGESISPLALAA